MQHVYKLSVGGEESYYSSLAAIWDAYPRESLGVGYKQVCARGVPYANKRITITRHEVRAKKHRAGEQTV